MRIFVLFCFLKEKKEKEHGFQIPALFVLFFHRSCNMYLFEPYVTFSSFRSLISLDNKFSRLEPKLRISCHEK